MRSPTITAVPGVSVGHHTDDAAATGVTVLTFPEPNVAVVDVRGGAPGTRELGTLGDAITAEAPLFLVRCVGALHRLIARAGKGSFWSVCPQSFRDAQRRMSDALNPLSAFIRSDDVILRPDEKTLSSDFRRAFREFGLCQLLLRRRDFIGGRTQASPDQKPQAESDRHGEYHRRQPTGRVREHAVDLVTEATHRARLQQGLTGLDRTRGRIGTGSKVLEDLEQVLVSV